MRAARNPHSAIALFAVLTLVACASDAAAQPTPPDYDERYLASIYPAGGQRGQVVDVEFRSQDKSVKGVALHGLKDARGIVIDGAPGLTVSDVKNVDDITVTAKIAIAPDAAPGRRMLRVRNGRTGLTNFSYFLVGTLPEVVEKEKNNEPRRAQEVSLPVVVNGRISQPLDVDCFKFPARKGQRLIAAVAAHDFDSRSLNPRSFIDAALEVLDSEGCIVGDAADVLGLDPLVETTIPADGIYTAVVKLVNYQGYSTAVYRLTLGEVPYPTALYPVAIERGKSAELSISGPNVPVDAKEKIAIGADFAIPATFVSSESLGAHDLPVLVTDLPERQEAEPNNDVKSAGPMEVQSGMSGRFDAAGDVDWYRLRLTKGEKLRVEVQAQRYLRSAIDTQLELFDARGTSLQANDDLAPTDVEMIHDFETFDSAMNVDVPADGDYFLRVTEQTGTFGPRAVYHVEVTRRQVDVLLHAWPDAVPVWGPGTTAGFLVTLDRRGAFSNVELKVEGLPDGWTGSTVIAEGGSSARPRVLMTVTAAKDAKPGDVVDFQVVGRFESGGKTIERTAQPLTSLMTGDRQFCRVSPKMRAAVADDLATRVTSEKSDLNVIQGQNAELAIHVEPSSFAKFPVSVNLAGASFRCNLGVPQTLPVKEGVVRVPITCDKLTPGIYPIVVSLAWPSETRKGMPGPCTEIVHLRIGQATAAK
ncbi:MAG: hypothetical protein C0483_07035 [Pirellula sp.]|nr:hypothetical protein [Pirellula sp.]